MLIWYNVIMKQSRNATVLYIEPKRIVDWVESMRESPQAFSGRVFSICLLHSILHSTRPLSDVCVRLVKKEIKDYPELADEAKQLFPEIL